jgi:GTP-binding protein HflX
MNVQRKSGVTSFREKALLVQLVYDRDAKEEAEASLAELERLVDTVGATVVGSITQRRERPTAKYFVGEGKVEEIRLACERTKAKVVVFDNELSAVQVNNIDLAIGVHVIDRTELILQIFAQRAQSAEAKIQVELAQLEYLIGHIPVSEKQARFKGNIGMRGPGESPFLLRQSTMRRRIGELKKKLDVVRARRLRGRGKRNCPSVCLAGYTNSGKSTLLRAMSADDKVYVDDRLFATLDTKTRQIYLDESRTIMLTDTVGFISNLPHGLVASFRATLEVAVTADLLLVVADASDPRMDRQLQVVDETLKEIGAGEVPSLLLLNKCDTPEAAELLPGWLARWPDAIPISALHKEGWARLKTRIKEELASCSAS